MDLGPKVLDLGFCVLDPRSWTSGSGPWIPDLVSGILDPGFRSLDLGSGTVDPISWTQDLESWALGLRSLILDLVSGIQYLRHCVFDL